MALFERLDAGHVIHCGDVGGGAVFDELVGRSCTFVWGNMDYPDDGIMAYLDTVGITVPDGVPTRLTLDGKTFAVGYYLPRSSEAAAKALLDDAAAAIEADPSATINRINRLDPEFNRDDLYVFVVDMDSMSMVAHGYSRRLLNIHFPELKNRDGARVGEQILDAVEAGQDSVTYSWPNPVTERPEEKKTLIRKVGNYLVAVGYYQEPVTE